MLTGGGKDRWKDDNSDTQSKVLGTSSHFNSLFSSIISCQISTSLLLWKTHLQLKSSKFQRRLWRWLSVRALRYAELTRKMNGTFDRSTEMRTCDKGLSWCSTMIEPATVFGHLLRRSLDAGHAWVLNFLLGEIKWKICVYFPWWHVSGFTAVTLDCVFLCSFSPFIRVRLVHWCGFRSIFGNWTQADMEPAPTPKENTAFLSKSCSFLLGKAMWKLEQRCRHGGSVLFLSLGGALIRKSAGQDEHHPRGRWNLGTVGCRLLSKIKSGTIEAKCHSVNNF